MFSAIAMSLVAVFLFFDKAGDKEVGTARDSVLSVSGGLAAVWGATFGIIVKTMKPKFRRSFLTP